MTVSKRYKLIPISPKVKIKRVVELAAADMVRALEPSINVYARHVEQMCMIEMFHWDYTRLHRWGLPQICHSVMRHNVMYTLLRFTGL